MSNLEPPLLIRLFSAFTDKKAAADTRIQLQAETAIAQAPAIASMPIPDFVMLHENHENHAEILKPTIHPLTDITLAELTPIEKLAPPVHIKKIIAHTPCAQPTPLHIHGHTHEFKTHTSTPVMAQTEENIENNNDNYIIYDLYNNLLPPHSQTTDATTRHPLIIHDVLKNDHYVDVNDMASLALHDFFKVYDSTSDKILFLYYQLEEACKKIAQLQCQEATVQNYYNHAAELAHKLALEEQIKDAEQALQKMETELDHFLHINDIITANNQAFVQAKELYHAEKVKHSMLNYLFDYGSPSAWLEDAHIKADELNAKLIEAEQKLESLMSDPAITPETIDGQLCVIEVLVSEKQEAQDKVSQFTKLVHLEEDMLAKNTLYQEAILNKQNILDNTSEQELTSIITQKINALETLKTAHEVTTKSLDTIDHVYNQLVDSLDAAENHLAAIKEDLSAMGYPTEQDNLPPNISSYTGEDCMCYIPYINPLPEMLAAHQEVE